MSLFRYLAFAVVAAGGSLFGCNLTIAVFPFEQCSPRSTPVELPPDPEDLTPLTVEYHSTAGCTITFQVMAYSIIVVNPSDPRWTPYGGFDYEVRVEPEGPIGRLEQGVVPEDGRVVVPTVEGNTLVAMTVFMPDESQTSGFIEHTAIVHLDQP